MNGSTAHTATTARYVLSPPPSFNLPDAVLQLNKAWPIGHATIGMHQISIARYHANVEGPYEYKAKMARSFAESAIKKYMPLYCMQAGMSEQIATFMTNSFVSGKTTLAMSGG